MTPHLHRWHQLAGQSNRFRCATCGAEAYRVGSRFRVVKKGADDAQR